MNEQHTLDGDTVEHRPRAKHDPAEMSEKARAAIESMDTPRDPLSFHSRVYKMLDDCGIVPNRFNAEEFALFLETICDDYPLEWIDDMRDTIQSRGVERLERVIEMFRYSHKRKLRPGTKPGEVQEDEREVDSDERIAEWELEMWNRMSGMTRDQVPAPNRDMYDRLKERFEKERTDGT